MLKYLLQFYLMPVLGFLFFSFLLTLFFVPIKFLVPTITGMLIIYSVLFFFSKLFCSVFIENDFLSSYIAILIAGLLSIGAFKSMFWEGSVPILISTILTSILWLIYHRKFGILKSEH